jgi:hypothetical protein
MLSQPNEIRNRSTHPLHLFSGVLIFLVLSMGFVPTAMANSMYLYTGQPYSPAAPSFCNGTYTPICTQLAVTGYFTTASPLGKNLNNSTITPLAFSFTDGAGVFTFTSAQQLALSTFQVSTDASGNITGWAINLATFPTDCASVSGFECLGTFSNPLGSGDFSAYGFNLGTPSQVFGGGENLGTPGTWIGPIASANSGNLRESLTSYTDSIGPLVITWNQAFPDTNYTAACTAETTAGDFLLPTITSRSTNGMQVSPSDGGPPTGVLNCLGLPDFDSSDLRHGRAPFSGFPPSVTVNWNQAFSDTNYTVVCTVETAGSFASGFTSVITTVTPGSVSVVNAGYDTGTMHCLAVPDSDPSSLRHTRVPVSSSPSTVTVPWSPAFPDPFYVSVCSDQASATSADSAIAILANSKLPGSLQVIPELSGGVVHCMASQLTVTPVSIKGDVTQLLQSGAIKNAGLAGSLLSQLTAAAAAHAAGNCSTAAKIYQAFINELNAQLGKGVDTTAAVILITDAQFLIAHCP